MRDSNDDLLKDAEEGNETFYGVHARPQRSRLGKKADKQPRSKKMKRTSPIGGLHQRRNKRISW